MRVRQSLVIFYDVFLSNCLVLASSTLLLIISGMHFSQAVATIQSLVGSVKGVQILYSDKDPLGVNLVINLTNDGIKLIFDPINQRLKTIEVHDLTLLKLKYRLV